MTYVPHNFENGQILYASDLNEMDAQIVANEAKINENEGKIPTRLSQLSGDSTHRVVTDAQLTKLNGIAATVSGEVLTLVM